MGLRDLWQRQPINFQRPIAGPQPGQGMTPGLRGQSTRNGYITPFALEDSYNGPGRDSERFLQAQSATPLNAALSELEQTTGGIQHYKHKYRLKTPATRYYPKSPYWPDRRAPFLADNAYTSLRSFQKGFAPPGLQRSAGGLEIASYQVDVGNVNVMLAPMYSGARAPQSANQSTKCR